MRFAPLVGEHQRRASGAIDDPRGQDADNATVPRCGRGVFQHEAAGKAFWVCSQAFQVCFDFDQRTCFGGATVVVEGMEFFRQGPCQRRIAREKQFPPRPRRRPCARPR